MGRKNSQTMFTNTSMSNIKKDFDYNVIIAENSAALDQLTLEEIRDSHEFVMLIPHERMLWTVGFVGEGFHAEFYSVWKRGHKGNPGRVSFWKILNFCAHGDK